MLSLVAYIEAPDFLHSLRAFAASRDAFDVWFKHQLLQVSGVDLNQPSHIALPELLSSYQHTPFQQQPPAPRPELVMSTMTPANTAPSRSTPPTWHARTGHGAAADSPCPPRAMVAEGAKGHKMGIAVAQPTAGTSGTAKRRALPAR